MAARKLELEIDHREPPTICRDQRELVILEAEQDAVQDVARFIGRDRVGSLAQSVAQILLPNSDDFRSFELRQRRKFLFRQTENLEVALSTADGRRVFSIDLDLNFAR